MKHIIQAAILGMLQAQGWSAEPGASAAAGDRLRNPAVPGIALQVGQASVTAFPLGPCTTPLPSIPFGGDDGLLLLVAKVEAFTERVAQASEVFVVQAVTGTFPSKRPA